MTLAALLSHWLRNKVQLVMLLTGLALATALWSGVQALNAQARAAYATAAALVSEDGVPRLDGVTSQMPQPRFVELRRAGVLVSPVVEGRVLLGGTRVTLLGIDPLTAPPGTAAALADGDLQGFLSGDGYAHPETLAEIGATDMALAPSQAVPVGTVLVDIGTAQSILGMAGQISHLLLTGPAPDPVPEDLRLSQADTGAELDGLTGSFHLNLTAFGALAFAVGLFIVHSAVGLAFEQRRGLFRTLRSLGVSLRVLTLALALELALFALVAGLAGLVMGYVMAAALLPDVAATLRGLYGAPVPGSLIFSPTWALAGLAMAFAGATLAGGQALWRLWHMPVLAPAQPRAWAMATGRAMRWQVLGAGVLAVLAVALGLFGSGLIAGFALLAAALLAAALLTPAVLALCLRVAASMARAPVLHWFWADSRQNLPRLSLALMALMLALAANIGVGTMVASFRATFIGWLDQRLVAEMTITPRDAAAGARIGRVPRAARRCRPAPATGGRHARRPARRGLCHARPCHVPRQLAADTGRARPLGRAGHRARRADKRAACPPRRAVAGGQCNPAGDGECTDSGRLPRLRQPAGASHHHRGWFDRLYPGTPTRQLAIRTDDPAATRAALLDEFGLTAQAITDQAQAKALSLAIFERTFLITGALNVLTLSVAALALFATLVTLSGMRLVQLAPLWAMGLTVRHLAGLELARALVLAGLTMVLALPVGLMLAQVLLAVINVQAFGWRLPLQVFPADWARLALWAGLAMFAASAWPAWRLWRAGGGPLLRVFANER